MELTDYLSYTLFSKSIVSSNVYIPLKEDFLHNLMISTSCEKKQNRAKIVVYIISHFNTKPSLPGRYSIKKDLHNMLKLAHVKIVAILIH
jgi:hypothetical protein